MWVILWSNGAVMVFDGFGDQVLELQGPLSLRVVERLVARAGDVAQWTLADWRRGVQAHLTAGEWELYARAVLGAETLDAQGTSG